MMGDIGLYRVIVGLFVTHAFGWTCIEPVQKVFCRESQKCTMHFSIAAYLSLSKSFPLEKFDGTLLGSVYYSNGQAYLNPAADTNLTADTAGNIWLTLLSVQRSSAGTYVVRLLQSSWSCVTIFVLGVPTTPSISKNKDPSEGENVILTCSSTSTTIPSNHSLRLLYNWSVDGVDDPSDSRYTYSALRHTLTLFRVVKGDADKQFTCTATEDVTGGYTSVKSNVASLSVLYGPENVTFSPSATSYESEENTELPQITCSAACNPECSFQWIKKATGLIASNNNVLQLGSLEASEAGTYRCIASRSVSVTNSKNLIVNVIYGPYPESTTLSPAQEVYTVSENGVLPAITCHADCYPECSYTWTKLRYGLTSVIYRTAVLAQKTVNRIDAATYICSAVNEHKTVNSSTQKEVQVKVNYGPDGACDNVSSVKTFTEGDNTASIRCFSECYPGCSYAWSNGSGLLSNSEILSLGSVRRHQAGNYTFTVNNTAQTYSKSAQKIFTVVVNYAPDVRLVFSTTDHSESASLTLFCSGYGVPPNYTYTGLTQAVAGVQVPNPNTALNGTVTYSSIYFSKLHLQDTGNYTCRMNNGILDMNGILDQTRTVQLLVEVKPKILQNDLMYTEVQGNSVTIKVPVYSYPALQSMTFVRHNGTVITNDTRYRTSLLENNVRDVFYGKEVTLPGYLAMLIVTDLQEEDFVNYTLTVRNSRGSTSVLVSIIKERFPSIPKQFLLTSTRPSMLFEKGFNGGQPQVFVIGVSIADLENWITVDCIFENDQYYKVNDTFYKVDLNLDSLKPGTYTSRLIAKNIYGASEPLNLNRTFRIESEGKCMADTQSQVVDVAAGVAVPVVVIVIVVAVAVVVVVLRRKTGSSCICFTRNNRLLSKFKGKSQAQDTMPQEESGGLQMSDHFTGGAMYESLQGSTEANRQETYESITPTDAGVSHRQRCPVKGTHNMYANMPLK